jgi:hypothetical protein
MIRGLTLYLIVGEIIFAWLAGGVIRNREGETTIAAASFTAVLAVAGWPFLYGPALWRAFRERGR